MFSTRIVLSNSILLLSTRRIIIERTTSSLFF
nr:MAG TPA: hypothetical protein [Caudoviricetes sp.]